MTLNRMRMMMLSWFYGAVPDYRSTFEDLAYIDPLATRCYLLIYIPTRVEWTGERKSVISFPWKMTISYTISFTASVKILFGSD